MAYPQTATAPALARCAFDRARSLQLDTIITALDRRPPWPQRLPLRIHKAWLERGVPAAPIGGAR